MAVKTAAKAPTTLDEAVLLMTTSLADMSKRIAESDAKIAESDAKIAESDAKIAASDVKRTETEAKIQRSLDELSKKMAKTDAKIAVAAFDAKVAAAASDAKIAESRAETDRALQRLTDNVKLLTDKVKILTDNVEFVNAAYGGIGRGFGELVELIVIPKIRLEMNRHGHDFKRSKANKKFRFSGDASGRKDIVTEVDMFLYNGTETMAVEIKTSLSVQDVEKHIKQLKMLRKYEEETDLQDKKLYGAMVGVYVDYHARKFALKNGLYILEIIEEENRMKTAVPEHPRSY